MYNTDMLKNDIFFKLSKNARYLLLVASRLADKYPATISKERTKINKIYPIHVLLATLFLNNTLIGKALFILNINKKEIVKKLGFTDLASLFIAVPQIKPLKPGEMSKFVFESSKDFKNILQEKLVKGENDKSVVLSDPVKKILSNAYNLANKHDHVYVGTEHIFLSFLSVKNDSLIIKLKPFGLTYENVAGALSSIANYPVGILVKPENLKMATENIPLLSQIGKDLVEQAKRGELDPLIGREEEIEKIINVLSRRKKNNPVIVGEAGVGKTALVEGLAQRIAEGTVPGSLSNVHIFSLDIPSIIAGSKMRGDIEEKMLQIINEVSANPNIILFIDEIHNILIASTPGSGMDLSAILKPALVSNTFRCIGATTTDEFKRYFEEDDALLRRFHPVYIEEPSVEESVEILKRVKPILEKHHNISISDEALEGAVKLSDRFVTDRFLPDKAIDLLDEATASRRIETEVKYSNVANLEKTLFTLNTRKEKLILSGKFEQAKNLRDRITNLKEKIKKYKENISVVQTSQRYSVGMDTVRTVVSKWTGIPVSTLNQDEKRALLDLDKRLQKFVIGQKEAVKVVSSAIKRARAGISDNTRPWASFLFLGPTGVGKTELAKVLTKELFGDEDRLIQIDMSELMEMHSVSKLIGSPPGYVGYREGGQLTEAIRQNPHSVILFDEVEKAHPDVLNILLQILEYGHLTDGKGRKVNFKNTVVILTSNIGAEQIKKNKILGFISDKSKQQRVDERSDSDIEKAYSSMKNDLTKELKDTIRPELLNRLDDIVIFRSLIRKDAEKIVGLLIEDLNSRLKDEMIRVKLDKLTVDYIVKEGFSEEYGARPLRRVIQDKVENIVAEWILENGLKLKEEKTLNLTVVRGKVLISGK